MKLLLNLLGILFVLGFMFLISINRKAINFKNIAIALFAQFLLAGLLIKLPAGRAVIATVSDGVVKVLSYGAEGIAFVFGSLGDPKAPTGMIFAFQTLTNIVFISALVAVLYYVGILGFIVSKIGWVIGKVFKTSEVESFVAVANMFLGQTDSPILVAKYLKIMTDSEVMLVLVSGMGSMSVSIIAGYTALGIPMQSLLIASTLVPIGSIIISKIICPQTEQVKELGEIKMDNKGNNENVLDALSAGAMDGMNMAMAIGASLIAIISIVALLNGILGVFDISFEKVLSYIFAPIGYLMGLEGSEVFKAGELLGSKLILNEFVAFGKLAPMLDAMNPRTGLMLAVSLAGFANVSSIGICISGISVLCPEKRPTLAKLAVRAMIGGFCVSLLSSMIVGIWMLF
ncbi:NupC/NupG family nucleoside CNT transporter [Anaerococcus hydrogenalis]|uniref:Na+ dependent nucleoside transporter domain-containing protein n=1 Tax=Anaerococcus hydrogenalis TaxID=33029 RepID=A0A2N6UIU6_9FIRM|nr:nucleoside transporter C-terminal domain-containing protein [Anaerococcus hydrogenalis]MDK7694880.1 nucleoside transporter C-terminal domain-containing protein [Anaerococcus hydrogenalis]MDK7696566.1 nucleoside transporter C-terminal domain-containing protein [Anaerococcus hydrogenalis]MDK7707907.1 nucleoside transporter C-terminal domain-containing protein [Anaerococcus hydrogenalis]PMC81513.1 Na+ dependent nucleoside transporter domain-containing protein [Anaerococcus hydrogenalis]